jgi:hypothetical protein
MQHMLSVFKNERMAGVGATLKSCNQLIVWREYINHLSFAFITPLQAKQYIYFTHGMFLIVL